MRVWSFTANAQVLGVHARDFECGCNCGSMTMSCSTASGSTKWDFSSGGNLDGPEAEMVFTVETPGGRNPSPDLPEWATFRGAWARADFDPDAVPLRSGIDYGWTSPESGRFAMQAGRQFLSIGVSAVLGHRTSGFAPREARRTPEFRGLVALAAV